MKDSKERIEIVITADGEEFQTAMKFSGIADRGRAALVFAAGMEMCAKKIREGLIGSQAGLFSNKPPCWKCGAEDMLYQAKDRPGEYICYNCIVQAIKEGDL